MVDNIPEKGAAVQRDQKTFAVIPHIPGGMIDPARLRKIADVAERYNAKTLKITSEQRIAIIGVELEDIDQLWNDLDMKHGGFTGKRVRATKFCLGTTFCKKGEQDSVGMGMKLDERYHAMETPNKLKIGVSGCTNSCAESAVKDIGLIGTKKGWNLLVGGTSGRKPRIGDLIAKNLSDGDALNLIDSILTFYRGSDTKKRLGRFVEKLGIEKFSEEIR
ncbi:nitrite/sulfite reductase domain-containing protein [Methanobacterium paludis]|uniref:Nitrite reductase (NAD(P)H) n=1 Tax=Methanobacterium paludis (strain DSM 25820 / JCM 18151 / SWAN1) TaxID=868131 RepID=F6D5T7_METPW|nr:NAD(P)/FAD-dependent oxidoreductase [Methanobacterium paludis]AEG18890.1 Nitrite reductase (NAD(P)H) [Methanobacterium paludis]